MSVADELQKLQQLRDSRAINDDEFAQAKARVLDSVPVEVHSINSPEIEPLTEVDRERLTRQWACLLHLSILLGIVAVPIAGLVAPVLIWQFKKDELPALDEHGRNAINWIISSIIYSIGSAILILVVIGIPLLIAVLVCTVAFPIVAGVKANNGEVWKYPFAIEFVK